MLQASNRPDEILSWCRHAYSRGLPLWVPDWNSPFVRHHLQWFRNRHASGRKSSSWLLSANRRNLYCTGYRVDTISSVSHSSRESLPHGVAAPPQPQGCIRECGFGRYHDKNALKAAMHRTLLHDHPKSKPQIRLTNISWVDWTRWPHPKQHYGGSFEYWKSFDRFRQTNARLPIFTLLMRAVCRGKGN
jgi:hypothetical protein